MSTTTIAHPAPLPAPEKPPTTCAGCGEPAGSISAGTGYPVVRDRETGEWFHVRCRPVTPSGKAALLLSGVL